jgi:rRNA maturation endonuclease Nob1
MQICPGCLLLLDEGDICPECGRCLEECCQCTEDFEDPYVDNQED